MDSLRLASKRRERMSSKNGIWIFRVSSEVKESLARSSQSVRTFSLFAQILLWPEIINLSFFFFTSLFLVNCKLRKSFKWDLHSLPVQHMCSADFNSVSALDGFLMSSSCTVHHFSGFESSTREQLAIPRFLWLLKLSFVSRKTIIKPQNCEEGKYLDYRQHKSSAQRMLGNGIYYWSEQTRCRDKILRSCTFADRYFFNGESRQLKDEIVCKIEFMG